MELAYRYFRARRGYLDPLRARGVPEDGQQCYSQLISSPSRDVVPGLVRLGPGGLAEEMEWSVRRVRRALDRLDGFVMVHTATRVMYVVGAVRDDPPRNMNQLTAFARALRQIPFSNVIAAVCKEIDECVERGDKLLIPKWRELNCFDNRLGNSHSNGQHTDTDTDPDHKNKSTDAAASASLHQQQNTPTHASLCVLYEATLRKLKAAGSDGSDAERKAAFKDAIAEFRLAVHPDAVRKAMDAVDRGLAAVRAAGGNGDRRGVFSRLGA